VVVEEKHLLSFIDIDYEFGDVTDEDDILDLEAATECEDEEKVSEMKTSCVSEAGLSNERHEDHDNDVEPHMCVSKNNDIDMDYEFHNDVAFVQIELALNDKEVEETEGLSPLCKL
jgi:hypothetical protein